MKQKISAIPKYYLFGEAPIDVAHDFLHLERLAERTTPAQGHIRPHLHGDLNHYFFITRGGGQVMTDDIDLGFDGAAVVFVPAGTVHGFEWAPDVDGFVLTVATPHLDGLFQGRGDLTPPGERLRIWPVPDRPTLRSVKLWLLRLERELTWQAPAYRYAVEAKVLGLLTEVHRLSQRDHLAQAADLGPQRQLLTRFREIVEARFKSADSLTDYLHTLKVSEAQLRYACQKLGGKAPMQAIVDRRLVEAKRLLLYTNLTISEISLASGFDDAAYFSRLFSRHCGVSPKRFRLQQHAD